MTAEQLLQLMRDIGLDFEYLCDAGARVGQVKVKLNTPYMPAEEWDTLRGELVKLTPRDRRAL